MSSDDNPTSTREPDLSVPVDASASEMSQSQARQRLSVATNSNATHSNRNIPTSVPFRNALGRIMGATLRPGTNDTSWTAEEENNGQSPNSFVLDMPFGGLSNRQPQQLPVDPESPLGQIRSEPDPEPSDQQRRRTSRLSESAASNSGANNPEPEGLTGQASSIWDQAVNQNPELSGVMRALEKYIPFILIVVVKYLFEHATGIFVFIGLMITFYHGNSVVCREVSRQNRRSFWPLIAIFVNLTACIIFIYFVFSEDELYLCAVFLSIGKVNSLYDLVWYVGINDFILKFVAVIVKIGIALLPAELLPHRKRGNYFLFIESSNQLHRTLAPIPIWLHYLLESLHKDTIRIPAKVLGVILTAAYMVIKGKHILKAAVDWKNATTKLWKSTRYGRCPSMQEVKASGNSCPICHDSFQEPTILHCKHIFCEECVATWFDRERTCPMCRSQITDDPAWRDGSTSQFIQLF